MGDDYFLEIRKKIEEGNKAYLFNLQKQKVKKTLEEIYNENIENIFNILKEVLSSALEFPDDKPYTFGQFQREASNFYQQIQTESNPYSYNIISIMVDAKKRDGRLTFEERFKRAIENIHNAPMKDEEIIIKVSTIKACENFCYFLDEYKEMYFKNDTEEESSLVIEGEDEMENISFLEDETLIWKEIDVTDFAQLIYAFYEAKILTNQKNTKTKLVEQVAVRLNFPLPPRWESNLNESVNSRNDDYKPKIFHKLFNSYMEYVEKRRKKKEK